MSRHGHDHPAGAHDHAHGEHAHGKHGAGEPHVHLPQGADAERRIAWAIGLTGTFMVVEVIGGILSGSLALIADAGHMATDVGALVLAYAGIRLGRRPADEKRSYGYRRLEVLAAFVNGITLLALCVWIAYEAVRRLFDPVEVLSGPMMAVAVAGLCVNLIAFALLRGGAKSSVNVAGALVHVIGDLLGSVAAIAAAAVIWFTAWNPIDPLLSLLVAALIVRSGVAIVRRAGHILLEGTPPDIDVAALKRDLLSVDGLRDCFHVHVWSLTSGQPVATLHVRLEAGADAAAVLQRVRARLRERFGIDHSTIEIDFDSAMHEVQHRGG